MRASLRATVAPRALHHPFYGPGAGAAPGLLQSRADVMLLIASPGTSRTRLGRGRRGGGGAKGEEGRGGDW